MSGSTILGYGHYAPQRRVANAEIEKRLGLEPGWISAVPASRSAVTRPMTKR